MKKLLLLLVFSMVSPQVVLSEKPPMNVEIWEWQKYKKYTCITNVNPENLNYQSVLQVFSFVKVPEFDDYFYILHPMGKLEVTDHLYSGRLMVLFNAAFINDAEWVKMPKCPSATQ